MNKLLILVFDGLLVIGLYIKYQVEFLSYETWLIFFPLNMLFLFILYTLCDIYNAIKELNK